MTLTAECGWTLLRALVVGVLALLLARPVRALITNAPRGRRRIAWAALLLPYLTPVVLVGYAYSNFSLSLVHHPALNELLYAVLLAVKLTPVAVVVLHFAPSGLTREAIHCRRLLGGKWGHSTFSPPGGPVDASAGRVTRKSRMSPFSLRDRLAFFAHGPGRKGCVAFTVVFLFAFSEFDMASLLNVTTWTVSLFDAQAGGLPIAQSLRLAGLPILCEAVVLVVVLGVLFGGTRGARLDPERPRAPGPAAAALGWLYLTFALALGTVIPTAVVLRSGAPALSVLKENPGLAADVATSLLFAGVAALAAYLSGGWFAGKGVRNLFFRYNSKRLKKLQQSKRFLTPFPSRPSPGGRHTGLPLQAAFVLSVPGLLGALLLGLLVLGLFQWAPLRGAYDTPLPLVVTLMLLLFPFAVLLRVLLHVFEPAASVHAAALLTRSAEPRTRRSGNAIVSDMVTRPRLWVGVLLFVWGYFEVVASSLLAPSGMTPVFVRLYNLMHYGQITGLSAMVLASMLVPVVLLGAAELVRGFIRVRSYG